MIRDAASPKLFVSGLPLFGALGGSLASVPPINYNKDMDKATDVRRLSSHRMRETIGSIDSGEKWGETTDVPNEESCEKT